MNELHTARPINWDEMGSSEKDMWEERQARAAARVAANAHKIIDVEIERYAGSIETRRATYVCACGKRGSVEDGVQAASAQRARAAHARHAASVTK